MSVKTVFMITIQLLPQLQKFHSKGKVSGNITLEDILVIEKESKVSIKLKEDVFQEMSASLDSSKSTPFSNSPSLFSAIRYDKLKNLNTKDDLE